MTSFVSSYPRFHCTFLKFSRSCSKNSQDNIKSPKLKGKGSKGVMWGSRDPILEFWDPLISRERLKLETSNLARRQRALNSDEKNAKLGQKRSCGSHMTQFWNFGTPLLSRERLRLETSNLAWRPPEGGEF